MFHDKIDEAIAHFIGLFDTHAEAARLRKGYDEFNAHQRHTPDHGFVGGNPVALKAPYDLQEFEPGVVYDPFPNSLVKVVPDTFTNYRPLPVKEPGRFVGPNYENRLDEPYRSGGSGHGKLDPQGSAATYISQQTRLTDNDSASAGFHGLVPGTPHDTTAELARMLHTASEISPLAGIDTASVTNDINSLMAFIDTVAGQMRDYVGPADAPQGYDLQHFYEYGATPRAGTFVNGVAVDEAPVLDDHLRIKPDEEDVAEDQSTPSIRLGGDTPSLAETATGETKLGVGEIKDHAFVDIKTGSNTLVNTAYIGNQWAASHVMATAGNYHQIDVISQVNLWTDQDAISASLNGWRLKPSDITEAFNVAVFTNTDLTQEHYANLPAPGQYPTQWAVTTLHGDLTILSWVEQLAFMSDNDIAIASSNGLKITLGTGENVALDDAFVKLLGGYYDLIMVGGNIYDASMISQTNVLLDNDLIQALNGFKTYGQGDLSAGNNLLWNQASIENLHGAGVTQGLPDGYQQAIDNLNSGNEHLPNAVMKDGAFEGMAGLRVLHITGNFVNLNYIKQTNVLGDNDQIQLAMNKVAADVTANWKISSGQNQLINQAAIRDVDFSGKVYAAGQVYSDAMLVQAELVGNAAKAGFGHFGPTALANEAVAFLQDDPWDSHGSSHKSVKPTHGGFDHGGFDALHGMLS